MRRGNEGHLPGISTSFLFENFICYIIKMAIGIWELNK
jgi:hypothetical protein